MKKQTIELGRSMVEMLGVLAVIGVLSVVGIAGYKKAMLKYRANELMNAAMETYHQALAKAMLHAGDLDSASDEGKTAYCLYWIASSSGGTAVNGSSSPGMNTGATRPSFMTDNYFNIYVNLRTSTSNPLGAQTWHAISFFGMNRNCDLCTELKSFTTKVSGTDRRLLPGSKKAPLTGGIQFRCFPGAAGSSYGDSCWTADDPD